MEQVQNTETEALQGVLGVNALCVRWAMAANTGHRMAWPEQPYPTSSPLTSFFCVVNSRAIRTQWHLGCQYEHTPLDEGERRIQVLSSALLHLIMDHECGSNESPLAIVLVKGQVLLSVVVGSVLNRLVAVSEGIG